MSTRSKKFAQGLKMLAVVSVAMLLTTRVARGTIILEQSEDSAVGTYGGAFWALSDSGFTSSGDPLEQPVFLTSVGFKNGGSGGTTGDLYLKVFTGSTGGLGTFVGVSSNTVDFASLSSGAIGTWTFDGLELDKDATYSYVFGPTSDSSNPSSSARFRVSTTNQLAGNLLNTSDVAFTGTNDPFLQITAENPPFVPEPSTGLLLGLSAFGMTRRLRRKKD